MGTWGGVVCARHRNVWKGGSVLSLPTSQQAPNFGLKLALKHCMALVRSLFLFGTSKGDR